MRGLNRDTVVEMFDRKIIWLFAGLTAFSLLLVFLTRGAEFNVHIETGGDADLSGAMALLSNPVLRAISAYLSFLVFLAVMSSAGHIPHMTEKGRIDFYLARPITRTRLLLGRFLALLTVYGSIVMASGLLVYFALIAAHGGFDANVFYLFGMFLAVLALWLAITTLVGVQSGSTAMAILTAFLIWVAQSILASRTAIKAFIDSNVTGYLIDALYYIVPKPSAMTDLGVVLSRGETVKDWLPLWSSMLFAVAALYAATLVFRRKDY